MLTGEPAATGTGTAAGPFKQPLLARWRVRSSHRRIHHRVAFPDRRDDLETAAETRRNDAGVARAELARVACFIGDAQAAFEHMEELVAMCVEGDQPFSGLTGPLADRQPFGGRRMEFPGGPLRGGPMVRSGPDGRSPARGTDRKSGSVARSWQTSANENIHSSGCGADVRVAGHGRRSCARRRPHARGPGRDQCPWPR